MTPTGPVWDVGALDRSLVAPVPASSVDVAVVGGGLSGLSAAYHILGRRPGWRVAVIEAGRVGAGASGRNTGLLGPGVGQSLESLVRRQGDDRARALYSATLEAVSMTVALVEREGLDCDLVKTGQIVLARSRVDRRRLRRRGELMTRLGLPHFALDDDALQARVRLDRPAGTARHGPAGLYLPGTALLHPGKLVTELARRVVKRGGALVEGWRARRLEGGGRGEPVRMELAPAVEGAGEAVRLTARRAVVATAGYTPALGLLRGRLLPVQLQALATAPLPAAALDHLGWRGREGIVEARQLFDYFRLTADDRLVFGGGAPRYPLGGRCGRRSERRALARLEREMRRRLAAVPGIADLPVTHAWTGVIGCVLDALPAIGPRRDRPGVVQLLGWCGHGLALSVAAGAWAAAMLDGEAPAALPWFRDRPPLLPFEPLRWLAFRAVVTGMALRDRLP